MYMEFGNFISHFQYVCKQFVHFILYEILYVISYGKSFALM